MCGRADAGLADHAERVVLLQEQLAGRVEAEAPPAARLGEQLPGALDDAAHRGLPVGLDELAVPPDQRACEAVGGAVGLPAEEVLGTESAVVDAIRRSPANADDPPVLDRDVLAVAVGVQDRGRGHPALDVLLAEAVRELDVDPHRPRLAGRVRRPLAPRVGDAIGHEIPGYPGRRRRERHARAR